MHNPT